MSRDPFEVLGLGRDASVAELRAARKRLALVLHPDLGGDARAMQEVNVAFEAAVAHATGRRRLSDPAPSAPPSGGSRRTSRGRRPAPRPGFAQVDEWSFVVEALPVEAFEALVVVTGWVGEVLVDDPPYLLEVHLEEPAPCWCRLTLVPDAGASTVSLVVAPYGDAPPPHVDEVRDMFVERLNQLGRWQPDE